MSTRRDVLRNVRESPRSTHPGLWLDRFIANQAQGDDESKKKLVKGVEDLGTPDGYSTWYSHWGQSLTDLGAECHDAEVKGRMAIGLGDESVLETSVAIHHTYGVPYIPGSALKGLAAAFARQHLGDEWQPNSDAFKIVFGDTKTAGYITFFDALPLPGRQNLLHRDIITVHHPNYYQGKNKPPADWDDPTPVPFLSATGKYLIALSGPEKWVTATFNILEGAFAHLGVGAKTSSGYGRLKLDLVSPVTPEHASASPEAAHLIARVQALGLSRVATEIHPFYMQWKMLQGDAGDKRLVAEAIVAKVKAADRHKKSREKEWYQELLGSIE